MSFDVGNQVRLRKRPGDAGEVLAVYPSPEGGDEPWYKVRFANGTMTVSESALMEPGIPDDAAEQLRAGLIGGMSELRLLLTVLRLKERNLTDQLRSLRAARLQHLPYQYKPLLKFLESDEQRVLIADEVGLGKTIEAGLILLELMARQEVSRVLVVVPSNLIIKWQTELRERFELDFEHRDNRWIREVILAPAREGAELPRFQAVVGLESVRLLAAEFDQLKPPLDLVIVDEAHRMRNDSSLGHKLGRALGESSEAMLLCSATPMQTASTDLHNLLRVMLGERAGSFRDFESDLTSNRPIVLASSSLARNEPASVALSHLEAARSSIASQRPSDLPALDACIEGARRLGPEDRTGRVELLASLARLNWFGTIMTRTRKRMVLQNVAPRVAKAVPLEFTPEEMEFYRSVCEQTRSATSGSRWDGNTFSAIMRQRQAASCLAAFREQALEGDAAGEDQGALRDEMSVDEDQGAEEDGRELRIPELPTDSKLRAFLGLLDELRRENPRFKLIVFATFRATVSYLARKLTEKGWEYEVLTGSVTDRAERMARVHRVRDDRDCNILLATEVGGEGIDLQFASDLVNYDLPWNPMTVEQRIGRLDRIGQTAPQIRIFNLCVNGTVEERILTRLYERLHLFEQSIGALEVIVGERIQRLALDLARLSPEEQNARLDAESLVLEAMQHDAARLDAEAVNLVGDDAYYSQRLLQIEARQGDIAEDLRIFVVDFLRREFKRADLIEADRRTSPGVLQLTFDSEFHEFIAARREMFGPASRFVGRYVESRDRGLLVTFDQKVAEARRDVEFITTTHGLIRAIADLVDANRRAVSRAFSVKVKTSAVPAGTYVVGIALHRVSGIRPRNEIVPAVVPLEDGPPLTSDQAETIAAEVLRAGESARASFTGAILAKAATRVELALVARCRAVEREVEQETRVSTGRRVESLKRWYGSRIQKAREQADHHPDERVRRMARGRLAKLEVRLEQEIRAAEGAQRVESSSAIEGFVVVSVAA